MLYNIVQANPSNIEAVLEIGYESYIKYQLNKYFRWDNLHTRRILEKFLESPDGFFYVAKQEELIVGFFIAMKGLQLYNPDVQFIDLSVQPSPRLPKITQAKVLLLLIDKIDELAQSESAGISSISIMPMFDISKCLLKRGYVLTDLIYSKKIN